MLKEEETARRHLRNRGQPGSKGAAQAWRLEEEEALMVHAEDFAEGRC